MFMNYQSVYTISPSVNAVGTWSIDGQLIPNPLSFGAATYTDSGGVHPAEFWNTQIPGANHAERLGNFLADFKRWRLAYAAVTIYQDGPDLANQGTVVVCQKPVQPVIYNLGGGAWNTGQVVPPPYGLLSAFHMEADDLPNFQASQAMPNAYFGKSKEGAYIPLKLTHSHQAWHSAADMLYQASFAAAAPFSDPVAGGLLSIPNSANAVVSAYPFYTVNDLHTMTDQAGVSWACTATSNFTNENWADFSFRNLAVTTSLSFFFRFGFEMQTQPVSVLAPHLKLSPEFDAQAIDTYFKISRELKDAYPAEYNDLGKIWEVISGIAKTIAPALAAIPVAGPILSMAVPGIAAVGDRIKEAVERSRKPTMGNVASESDREIAGQTLRKPATTRSYSVPRLPLIKVGKQRRLRKQLARQAR